MIIPKRIFQTWKSKFNFPQKMKPWIASWKDLNPDYEYVLWDDDDNRKFIKEYFPWFLNKYDSYPKEIYRCDAVRYFYLFYYGGIYADLDFQCLKNFDPLLNNNVVLGRMTNDTPINNQWSLWCFFNNVPNAIMLSEPGAKFWIIVMWYLLHSLIITPETTTGPIMLKKALLFYENNYNNLEQTEEYLEIIKLLNNKFEIKEKSRINILENKYLYPIDWTNREHDLKYIKRITNEHEFNLTKEELDKDFGEAYAITYWCNTWDKNIGKLK